VYTKNTFLFFTIIAIRVDLVSNLATNDVYLSLPVLSFLSSYGDDNRINRILERIKQQAGRKGFLQ